jgi:DNA-directed RNA polymerase specialized sigma24 family protein
MDIDNAYNSYFKHPTEETLTALFSACRSYAVAIALSYHAPDAENAASEAVARAWVSLSSYRHGPDSSFRAWFRSIVKNTLCDFARKPANRYGASAMDWETVEIAGQNHDEALRSVDEINDLNDEQRLTLKIFSVCEDFGATARQLGISRKALDKRLAKIKEKRCA